MPHDLPTNYAQFTTRDFVLDESFRRWVLQPDEATMSFWHTFMLRYPAQQAHIDEAATLLLHLRTNYDDLTEASYERIWTLLEQAHTSHSDDQTELDVPVMALNSRRNWPNWLSGWRVAVSAVGLLGLLATGWYWREQQHKHVAHTTFGETTTITLPDGSTVQLNGNSTLTYRDDWAEGQAREVWLEGEGFFIVTKKAVSGQGHAGVPRNAVPVKFTTHTPGLDVQVLGTQFNVNTRRGQTDVTLVEGKVKLIRPNNAQANVLEMRPGQVATARPGIEAVALQKADPQPRTAWTQQQYIFEKTPLRDIAQQLSDAQGLTLVFGDDALADRRFTGNLSSENLETLLTTLAATFDLTVERDSNTVYLRKSK
ncbi:FecR domain-containing protein [Fibrella sp. HMF5335]|uniref:FecR domain-containing protein n=1 Tax=Fibrella rubiginis TaxID=2817060 RepID=A0A939GG91_9BACT|nr:FecR domain-containing protein [Fibrella rubiginis]MBO0938592.1 FecR domain-containing protein [Fibrella rubiginis]